MYYNHRSSSYYSSDRDKNSSRSRSRNNNKHHKRKNSKSSSSSNDKKHKKKQLKKATHNTDNKKRIRFAKDQRLQDIKCFKKQDQPNARGLSEAEIIEYKRKLQINSNWYNNASFNMTSEQIKHRQSLMEGQSMKLHKQREKNLNEKILLVRQEISYYIPPKLKVQNYEKGAESIQKQAHNVRLNSTLGCFYSKLNEIPDEPDMTSILNNVPSKQSVKRIMFEKPTQKDHQQISKFIKNQQKEKKSKQQKKPLKGILKRSLQEIRKIRQRQLQLNRQKQDLINNHKLPAAIDQNLIKIVKDITTNKGVYTPQMIQNLLRPYKYNGSLQNVIRHIKEMSKTPIPTIPTSSTDPMRALSILQDMNKKGMPINSIPMNRPSLIKPEIGGPPNPIMIMPPSTGMMMNQYKNEKYRTVPCKYFHSPQGCQRKTDCTFIHDEMYAGRQTPQMMKSHIPNQIFTPPMQPLFMMKAPGILPPPPPMSGYIPSMGMFNMNNMNHMPGMNPMNPINTMSHMNNNGMNNMSNMSMNGQNNIGNLNGLNNPNNISKLPGSK